MPSDTVFFSPPLYRPLASFAPLPYFSSFTEEDGHLRKKPTGKEAHPSSTTCPPCRRLAPTPGDWADPPPEQHKGTAGKVLIIGGSVGMSGAPALAARGALRTGAGLIHVACPAGIEPQVHAFLPEILTHPIGEAAGFRPEDAPALLAVLERITPDSLVIGPGMGRSEGTKAVVQAVLNSPERPPLIVDADALHVISPFFPLLRKCDLLTPHPGEAAALLTQVVPQSILQNVCRNIPQSIRQTAPPLHPPAFPETDGFSAAMVQADRVQALYLLTQYCPACVLLKGAGTLIGRFGNPTTLAPFAQAVLGVGGSGDVLAGICAALMAGKFQGKPLSSLDAGALAVYLHGRGGELLAERAPRGHSASEIADSVPLVWKELCRK